MGALFCFFFAAQPAGPLRARIRIKNRTQSRARDPTAVQEMGHLHSPAACVKSRSAGPAGSSRAVQSSCTIRFCITFRTSPTRLHFAQEECAPYTATPTATAACGCKGISISMLFFGRDACDDNHAMHAAHM